MRLQSRVGRNAVATVAIALLAAAAPGAAQAASGHEDHMRAADADRHLDAHHQQEHSADRNRDQDHHSPHHHYGRGPNGVYYIYPHWYGWTYRYVPAPRYWYYCRSYGAYYPYVENCPEAWVPVPGS